MTSGQPSESISQTSGPPESTATREQVIQLIRFNLDELSSMNSHHRFEDLCRHFARERLAPNILPSTGPVGVGGDRGRDFETFRSFLREELGPYGAFAGALKDGDALAFLCTLQRDGVRGKILSDVAKVMSAGTSVSTIYAFLAVPLAKANRDAVQDEVRERDGVHLEVIDGRALAEALAHHDIFWIAEQFLSIPAAMRPEPPSVGPELPAWYVADRDRWRRRGHVNPSMGELLDVLDGARYSTFHPEARGDLPFWLELVRALDRDDVPHDVRQRARYEVAASQLRGMGNLRPADDIALAYLRNSAEHEEDPARLQDAANLMSYAQAAVSFGHSDIDASELSALNRLLRERVRALLAADPPRTRRARLLEVLGHFAVMPDATSQPRLDDQANVENAATLIDRAKEDGVPDEVIAALPAADIDEAMRSWTELAGLLKDTPLYPVEGWARMLDFFAPLLLLQAGWEEIEHAVDDALERVRGGDAAAVRSRSRALRLLEEDRLLDALHELHRAAGHWWSGDNLRGALLCMLGIADIYKRLRLPQAAKQYALAVVTGAHSSSDDDVADLVGHAILVASEIEYAAGAWASAIEHVDIGLLAKAHLVDHEVDVWAERDIQNAVTTVGMALRAAEQLVPELLPAVEAVAERHGMLDDIRNGLAGAPSWDAETWTKLADDQLMGRPFSDLGVQRSLRFGALGTHWTVQASSEYRATRAAERLAAAAQIVLAELATDDLCLMPVALQVEVLAVGDVEPERRVVRDTSAPGWRWVVRLQPLAPGEAFDEREHFTETLGVVTMIVSEISLLPPDECLNRVTAAFERGLGHKLAMGRPYEELAEIVPPKRYAQTPREVQAPLGDGVAAPAEHPELAWREGPGPTYSKSAAREALVRRYQRLPEQVRHTVAQLREDTRFAAVVSELRGRGWRDWHILTAIAAIVGNERLARAGLNAIQAVRTPADQSAAPKLILEPDSANEPRLPADRFDVESMQFARRVCVPPYLVGWDLQLGGAVPDFEPVERLLEARYGYWTDDIEHDEPFSVHRATPDD